MFILKKEFYMMFIKKPLNFIEEIKKKNYYNVIVFMT